MNQSNTRKEETFHKVEAVSFRDYNQDGYTDIIIICSYIPDDRTKSVYSEARLYFGSAEGSFTLDVDLSEHPLRDVIRQTLLQIARAIKIRKTLRQINRLMLLGQGAHLAKDSGAQ